MKNSELHVVGVYSNPRDFAARKRLALEWIDRQLAAGTTLTFVEHAFGRRPWLIEEDDPRATYMNLVQLRGGAENELWLKEPLINRGLGLVINKYDHAHTVVWEDTDVTHTDSDWVRKTLNAAEHNRVGQTWTHSMDLDPKGNVARNEWGNDVDRSFSAAWLAGDVVMPTADYTQEMILEAHKQPRDLFRRHGKDWDARCHYGFSWFAQLDVFRKGIGKLPDWLITGSADYVMAMAFAGLITDKMSEGMSPGWKRRMRELAINCDRHVRQDIGVVDGTILHGWHGRKRDRQYLSRAEIIANSKYDPDVDIAIDTNCLPFLCTDNRILRDGLRRYNIQRNEDSIDVY